MANRINYRLGMQCHVLRLSELSLYSVCKIYLSCIYNTVRNIEVL